MSEPTIKVFKLVTGEEIISEVGNWGNCADYYMLNNPCIIMLQPTANGQLSVVYVPFMGYSDEPICIFEKDMIGRCVQPKEEFINRYRSMFQKIVTPKKELILG